MSEPAVQANGIAELVGTHISEVILGTSRPIDPDQNLLIDGGVDSLGMLKLVGFLELTYDVKIPPDQFTIENFRSINVISNYMLARIGDDSNA